MKSTLSVLDEDLSGMRTGRASSALVEKLMIEYYGTPTPLFQLAGISIPDPQTIMISPYDPSTLQTIEKAIQSSDLSLTPNNDGTNIRLNIPSLTQERRQELMKMVNRRLEEARVAIRNIRRHAIDELRHSQKEGEISEDEMHDGQDNIQKMTDKYIDQIDETGKRKEHEIMEV
jgi:ribosome recycling factor